MTANESQLYKPQHTCTVYLPSIITRCCCQMLHRPHWSRRLRLRQQLHQPRWPHKYRVSNNICIVSSSTQMCCAVACNRSFFRWRRYCGMSALLNALNWTCYSPVHFLCSQICSRELHGNGKLTHPHPLPHKLYPSPSVPSKQVFSPHPSLQHWLPSQSVTET